MDQLNHNKGKGELNQAQQRRRIMEKEKKEKKENLAEKTQQ
jgi:hypothetical protein